MKKEELINHVKESIKREESATSIYLEHLKAIITRSNIAQSDIEKATSTIKYLINSNRVHKKQLENLLKKIQEESCDVF
ncbi:MAG: hypothetical protein KKC46_06930 [Proteobacteria bacterium]|nr:hypothetical protein [Pseudomonadota bacterium]